MRSKTGTFLLGVLAILLAVILLWVLYKNQALQAESENLREQLAEAETARMDAASLVDSMKHGQGEKQKPKQVSDLAAAQALDKEYKLVNRETYASIPAERFFTTSNVTGLVPENPKNTFNAGQRVFVYAGIHAPQRETVQLKWYDPDGNLILPSIYKDVLPNEGPTGFRIYTYRVFRNPGKYSIQLLNAAGQIIGETTFTIL